jgi:hypothetical protein
VDYLQETNPAVRWVAALALAIVTLFFALMAFGGAIACAVVDFPPRDGASPRAIMLLAAGVCGLLSCCTGLMTYRLLSGQPSANGVTLMSTWFISGFGVLFFAALVWVAVVNDSPSLLVESGIVALAMILVGRLARAKRRAAAEVPPKR